ncbi:MAG: hypothetical protein JSV89_06640 [Spirochaetaceae bacterium]|nr:MAG: hypothetical protein JSV89_06640 [Spirochaetaceae bacterium]
MGVLLAVLSGVAHNIGVLMQKKVVNKITSGRRGFFARLIRHPLWLAGFVVHMGLGSALFLLAQARLGPALIPGLMASGLVVLVLGSIWFLKERLGFVETAGILLLITAITLLGFSRISIDLGEFNVLAGNFLLRAAVFSLICATLILILEVLQKRITHYRGSVLAISSGLFYALSNFWVGPFMGAVLRIFNGRFNLPVISLFATGSAILMLTNMYGIAKLQLAFRITNASLAIPIQQIPIQSAPAVVYLAVFRLAPPSATSMLLFCAAIPMVIGSSFVLARRQGMMEAIQVAD